MVAAFVNGDCVKVMVPECSAVDEKSTPMTTSPWYNVVQNEGPNTRKSKGKGTKAKVPDQNNARGSAVDAST